VATAVLLTRIGNWSLTSLQQRLVKTGGRVVKHARYYWLLWAESHLTRRLFGAICRKDRRFAGAGGIDAIEGAAKSGGQDVEAAELYMECTEKKEVPGFRFSGQARDALCKGEDGPRRKNETCRSNGRRFGLF
jgi:hypothetical protein